MAIISGAGEEQVFAASSTLGVTDAPQGSHKPMTADLRLLKINLLKSY